MGNLLKVLTAVFFTVCGGYAQINWSASNITIATEAQLRQFAALINSGTRSFANQTVTLANDINLVGGNWIPVGKFVYIDDYFIDSDYLFQGTFDGGGNVIRGVTVRNTDELGTGLFTALVGTIKNLRIIVDIAGTAYVGGLVGYNYGIIENCYVSGNVSGTMEVVGGMLGGNVGTVRNSYTSATVNGGIYVGGLAGANTFTFADANNTIEGTILNCYSSGAVTGNSNVGGLVGAADIRTVITNSYALQNNATDVFVGINFGGALITNSGMRNSSQMQQRNNFIGWDFVNLWRINASVNNGFPYLFFAADEDDPIINNPVVRNPLYPFPQAERFIMGGSPISPSNFTQLQQNADVIALYNAYRDNYLDSAVISGNETRYFIRTTSSTSANPPITISEAHGYAMMIFALMAGVRGDEKMIFDGMNTLRKLQRSTGNSDLMSWVVFDVTSDNPREEIGVMGSTWTIVSPGRSSSATDGDFDNAYALLLAYKQWGDEQYLQDAKRIISALKISSMHPNIHRTNLGDWHTGTGILLTSRSSDWKPGHFRAFAKATDDEYWNIAADTVYDRLLAQVQNTRTGLVPDFVTGIPARAVANAAEALVSGEHNWNNYSFNACRVPWRLALDYVHHGTPAAKRQIDRISNWLRSENGANANPYEIASGYTLQGEVIEGFEWSSMAFVAPFASGMLANENNQAFLDDTYDFMREFTSVNDDEYRDALRLLNMLLITGNWWAPHAEFLPPQTSVRKPVSRNNRYGIVLENAVARDTARITVKTPEPATVTLRILDNLGNAVRTVEAQCLRIESCELVWDLRNSAGRFVGNGTYLAVAEATGISGRIYRYSARIGVSR